MLLKTMRIANKHTRSTNQLLATLWPRNNAKMNIDKKDCHETNTINIEVDINLMSMCLTVHLSTTIW